MIVTHLGVSVEEHEEHVISILASLFKNCSIANNAAKQRERLLGKENSWCLLMFTRCLKHYGKKAGADLGDPWRRLS
jgi:hypothetical protein